jgi:hypothetical protein
MRPIETGAGKQLHRAMIEARMHAIAVEFDFVEPAFAVRRRVDELGQLRPDPLGAARSLRGRREISSYRWTISKSREREVALARI